MSSTNLFFTPIWFDDYLNFNEEKENILNAIFKYKEENPISKIHSNINGYQSPKFIHTKEELAPLFNYICFLGEKICDELNIENYDMFITSSWCNINDKKNCINIEHIHSDTFSGVFYVKVPKNSGKLCIKNTSINPLWIINHQNLFSKKNQFTSDTVKIDPVEGRLLMWPSYIPHYVEPNDHDDERISISFNMIILPKNSRVT